MSCGIDHSTRNRTISDFLKKRNLRKNLNLRKEVGKTMYLDFYKVFSSSTEPLHVARPYIYRNPASRPIMQHKYHYEVTNS